MPSYSMISRDIRIITPVVRPHKPATGRSQGNLPPYSDNLSRAVIPATVTQDAYTSTALLRQTPAIDALATVSEEWTTIEDFREQFRDEGILLPSGGDKIEDAKSRWRDHVDGKLEYDYYTMEKLQEMSDARGLELGQLKKGHLVATLKAVDKAREDAETQSMMSRQLVDALIATNERIIRSVQRQQGTGTAATASNASRAWKVEVSLEDQTDSTFWIPLAPGPAEDEHKDVVVVVHVSRHTGHSDEVYDVQLALGDISIDHPKYIQITSYFSLRAQDVSVDITVEDLPDGVYIDPNSHHALAGVASPRRQDSLTTGFRKFDAFGQPGAFRKEYRVRKSTMVRRTPSRRGDEQRCHRNEEENGVEVPNFFTRTLPFIFS